MSEFRLLYPSNNIQNKFRFHDRMNVLRCALCKLIPHTPYTIIIHIVQHWLCTNAANHTFIFANLILSLAWQSLVCVYQTLWKRHTYAKLVSILLLMLLLLERGSTAAAYKFSTRWLNLVWNVCSLCAYKA